jgi:hypothetical protein
VESVGSSPEQLSQESERLLQGVPDVIGEDVAGSSGDAAPGDVQDQDPIAALMAQVAFEPQDVQDVLAECFDWLSERFESEHWRLTDRQARMLGRPTAQLLNSLWARLGNYLPDILSRWCEETPGAMAFLMAAGMVVAPKVMQQVSISRERKEKKPMVQKTPIQAQPTRPAGPLNGAVPPMK